MVEYENTTPKLWAQDVLMDIISQYNYRLEDKAAYSQDKMTEREKQLCMEQLKKQVSITYTMIKVCLVVDTVLVQMKD